jgi:hypothetical protein
MVLHSDPDLLHEDIHEQREAVTFSEQDNENLKFLLLLLLLLVVVVVVVVVVAAAAMTAAAMMMV